MLKNLCFLLLFFCLTTITQALPFKVLSTKEARNSKHRANILFEKKGLAIIKTASASKSDFNNLYAVNTEGLQAKDLQLNQYGKILFIDEKNFALLQINSFKNLASLSRKLHQAGLACGTIIHLDGTPIFLQHPKQVVPVFPTNQRLSIVEESIKDLEARQIKNFVTELSSIETRYHSTVTGKKVAELLAKHYQAYAQNRDDVEIKLFNHTRTEQPSIIVRIKGIETPDEVVILGSHIDSVNWQDGSSRQAPGADDNASGTATNLEIFRVIMNRQLRFKRSIEIHGYAAEEIGLVGSQEIAQLYRQQNKNVIAMTQFDMNIYSPDDQDKIWIVTNNTHEDLNLGLKTLIESYLDIAYGEAMLSGGSSDHASWTRQGFAAAFPFENPRNYNRKIHTRHDTIENSGRFEQARSFAQLGLAYLAHYAGVTSSQ